MLPNQAILWKKTNRFNLRKDGNDQQRANAIALALFI